MSSFFFTEISICLFLNTSNASVKGKDIFIIHGGLPVLPVLAKLVIDTLCCLFLLKNQKIERYYSALNFNIMLWNKLFMSFCFIT